MTPSLPSAGQPIESAGWLHRCQPEVLLIVALGMAAVIWAPLNTDSGYILVAGRRLLAGDRLYVDMMETNPPMIFWLMAFVSSIGRYLPLSDARLVGLLVAIVLLVTGVSTLRAFAPGTSRLIRFSVLSAFVLSLVIPYLIWVGQREQIAAMLTLPYTVLAARSAGGSRSSMAFGVWCGLLAGIGLAIKPFFLAAWAAIELIVFVTSRRLPGSARTDFWTVLSVQCVFGALVLTVTPEYFTRAVPLARATYDAYGRGHLAVLEAGHFQALVMAGALALVTPWCLKSTARTPYTSVFGAATLGWLVSYAAQGKGWYYHLLPAVVYATIALTLVTLDVVATLMVFSTHKWPQRVLSATFAVFIGIAAAWSAPVVARLCRDDIILLREQQPEAVVRMAEFIEQAASGEPVYFLSTSMWPAFPVVNMSGARWPYHYHFLWPIPSLYARGAPGELAYRVPAQQGALEREFFNTVIQDLRRSPPRVLVVDRREDQQAMRGRTFDFLKYFDASAEFRTFFRGYRRVGNIGPWDLYEAR